MENDFYYNILNNINRAVCITDFNENVMFYNKQFMNIFKCKPFEDNIKFKDLPSDFINISQIKSYNNKIETITKVIKGSGNTVFSIFSTFMDDIASDKKYCIEEIDLSIDIKKSDLSKSNNDLVFEDLIISDKSMHDINETISRISYFDSTVLIQGESGTGKSVLAKHIHNNSNRAKKPFITINCGSIPENLIESELFGYASGAFTSANKQGKAGQVELADGGTLFLDEIGLLPYNLQSKFLQLIQEKTYTPVGALKSKHVDVRIIAATNENLKEFIENKKFREDLYYRLRVIELFIPPLRERKDAIEMLVEHFLKKYNSKFSKNKTITSSAISSLKEYSWPGNIRELQYVIERTIITSTKDTITTDDIPPLVDSSSSNVKSTTTIEIPNTISDFEEAISNYEKKILTEAFEKNPSSYKLATALNLSQNKASRLLRKYDIKK